MPYSFIDPDKRVQSWMGKFMKELYQVTFTFTPIAPRPGIHGLTRESPFANDLIVSTAEEVAGSG